LDLLSNGVFATSFYLRFQFYALSLYKKVGAAIATPTFIIEPKFVIHANSSILQIRTI